MKTVSVLPREVVHDEHVWIPLPDGTRLAARIWRPEGSEEAPVPAILEYLPYRRRDGTRARDEVTHPYVAGHGYACVRVDMRGSGDSDGVLTDEYLPQEQEDGREVLRWIAQQPWCDGNLGMIGISWGGFNGLQIAAHRPEGLKAIITICSTDDRYADDIHYMGGTLLLDNLAWSSTMYAYNFRPPDPETAGDDWRAKWLERLEGSGFWHETWLEHQRRDGFWCQGSVCEDFSAVDCAVMAVGGWADAYTNAIPRLLAGLRGPRAGLIGPWAHKYPHMGVPGPAIGFLQESLRWWDRWLKGVENGVMDEPMLRAWIQDSARPATAYQERPGRWVGEAEWPSPEIRSVRLPLGVGTLGRAADGGEHAEGGEKVDGSENHAVIQVRSPLSVGLESGAWCSYGAPGDLPGEQRRADGDSVVFDSEPLEQRLEILGAPVAELELASDRPVAMVAVRLLDVHPDGSSTRVSYGLLNLTHRNGHAQPEPLEPGRRYRVRVQLNDIGQAFPPGHRVRLAVSTSYWPIAWPAPEPVTLDLVPSGSSLLLPVRDPRPEDDAVQVAMPAEGSAPLETTRLADGESTRRVLRDLATGEAVVEVVSDAGTVRIEDIDLEVATRTVERYTYTADDPLSATGEIDWTISYRRGDWKVGTRTKTKLTSDAQRFHGYGKIEAFEGDERIFEHVHQKSVDRDLV